MKKIMLTGAAGYLGQVIYNMGRDRYKWVLFDWCQPEQQEVRTPDAPDSKSNGTCPAVDPPVWITGDIIDRQAVETACAGCDAVIHTAALHTVKWNKLGDDKSFMINTIGTKNVLQAAVNNGIGRIVYTSSIRAVSHEKPFSLPTDEEAPVLPNELYGLSKAMSEQLCEYYARNHGIRVICLRPAAIRTSPAGSISFSLAFEWVDVRDVANAHLLSLEAELENKFEIMLITSRSPMNGITADEFYKDHVACMRKVAIRNGIPPDKVDSCEGFDKYSKKDPHKIEWFSMAKAEKLMGYDPQYGFACWPGKKDQA